MTLPAHLSIHDVAPETLEPTGEILDRLRRVGIRHAMLLVIPGKPWTPGDLGQLRRWSQAGHPLAGHGWHHRARRIRGWRHRLHSRLLSRDVAEHLALDTSGIAALMRDCHAWFAEAKLPPPTHYVPPAWAPGRIARAQLRDLPFRTYESLGGVFDAFRDRWHPMPVIGYEADTRWRGTILRTINSVQRIRSSPARPLRISIHPGDFRLRLADDLERLLEQPFAWFARFPPPDHV